MAGSTEKKTPLDKLFKELPAKWEKTKSAARNFVASPHMGMKKKILRNKYEADMVEMTPKERKAYRKEAGFED